MHNIEDDKQVPLKIDGCSTFLGDVHAGCMGLSFEKTRLYQHRLIYHTNLYCFNLKEFTARIA